jgi:hypothetical protein
MDRAEATLLDNSNLSYCRALGSRHFGQKKEPARAGSKCQFEGIDNQFAIRTIAQRKARATA